MNEPVLYILMRTDMASLNPGKAMAQASHVYGAVKKAVRSNLVMQPVFQEWMAQTEQEFGTTIVLESCLRDNEEVLRQCRDTRKRLVYGSVLDPTYPVQDGDVTHLIPVETCAFIFGRKGDCRHVTQDFILHD